MTITEALRLLELTPPFTKADIRKAYREAQLVWHPDRFPTFPELHAKATARSCLINEAFEEISRALEAGYDFKTIAPRPTATRRKAASQEPPPNAAEFNRRGVGFHTAGRPNKAIADFTEAIRLDRTVAVYFRNRGICYANRRKLPDAIADFTEAIRLDPNIRIDPIGALAFRARAAVYEKKGNYDNAILDLSEAIRLEPGITECYSARGLIYRKKSEYDKALADFAEVHQLDPKRRRDFRTDFREHGKRCELGREYDKAISCYTEVIKSFHGRDSWGEIRDDYLNRARVYQLVGDFDKAIADYTKVIKDERYLSRCNSRDIRLCRAQLYYDKGNFIGAIADVVTAIFNYDLISRSDSLIVGLLYAKWAYDEGRYNWSIENVAFQVRRVPNNDNDALLVTLQLGPYHDAEGRQNSRAVSTLAALYARLGDLDRAIQYQRRYLQLPDVTTEEAANGLSCLKLYETHLSIPDTPS